jgi:hypothetical protein
MSTKFGILTQNIEHEKLVDEDGDLLDYISTSIFEPVFHRGTYSRWINDIGPYLSDDIKVYALDNTQQGIFTIGDIKKFIKKDESNT